MLSVVVHFVMSSLNHVVKAKFGVAVIVSLIIAVVVVVIIIINAVKIRLRSLSQTFRLRLKRVTCVVQFGLAFGQCANGYGGSGVVEGGSFGEGDRVADFSG